MYAIVGVGLMLFLVDRLQQPPAATTTEQESYAPNPYCPWCRDPVLCARAFLFVVATGRSGSTTLMSMINSIPGFFIGGENGNQAATLKAMVDERRRAVEMRCKREHSADIASSSSCALLPRRAELKLIQDWIWVSNLPPDNWSSTPTQVSGFKEIRWGPEEIEFIRAVCPCSRFIINTRKDKKAQSGSGMYATAAPQLLQTRISNTQTISRMLPRTQVYRIVQEKMSVKSFNKLAAWLGAHCQFSSMTYANVNSSYNSYRPGMRAPCN
jgi:Sulfotransferase family